MYIRITCFLVLGCWLTAARAQTNVNVSNYPFADTEPCLAVNPTDPQKLVAAWMKVTGLVQVSIATAYSTNGGNSWSQPIVLPHLFPAFTHADPSLAYNADGSLLYLCYIDFSTDKDSGFVMVSRSQNNAQSWNTPVAAIAGNEAPDLPVDRPWIAVDAGNGSFAGRVYVVSKSVDIGALPHHVWMKSSADSGLTWSTLKQIDDSIPTALITNSMGVPVTGADGKLYIAYGSWDLSQSLYARFIVARSADGGNSFIPYVIANAVPGSAITDSLYQGSYHLAANPADPDNLVFIATDARYGDPDILAVHSADGGLTWTTGPLRINDDAVNNGAGQDMCWGHFNAAGIYVCAWRDRRNGGSGSMAPFEVYAAASDDGGATFSQNANLSAVPSPVIPIVRGNDFLGIAASGSSVFADWSDLRTGNTEIFFASIPLSTVLPVQEPNGFFPAMKVFPNPGSHTLMVQLHDPAGQVRSLELTDSYGSLLRRIELSSSASRVEPVAINLAGMAAGSYVLLAITPSGKRAIRFIRIGDR